MCKGMKNYPNARKANDSIYKKNEYNYLVT
jgi:hypothetical protein